MTLHYIIIMHAKYCINIVLYSYKSIPMSTGAAHTVGRLEENKPRNRFVNIFPCECT